MNIKLNLNNIKEFIQISSEIKSDSGDFVPVLRFIKFKIDFGECTMEKQNSNSFVIFKFDTDQDDCEFIVPEKEFNDFIQSCPKSTYIFLNINENGTNHSMHEKEDGKGGLIKKYDDGGYKIKDFPNDKISLAGLTYTRLSKSQLESIGRAKNYVGEDSLQPFFTHVFISFLEGFGTFISGNTNTTFYSDKQNTDSLPFIALSKEECQCISKLDFVDYSSSEEINFNVFKTPSGAIYGYKKMHTPIPMSFISIFKSFNKNNYFTIKKEELVKFCTSVKLYNTNTDKKKEDGKWKNSVITVDGFGDCTICFDMEKHTGESVTLRCETEILPTCTGFSFEFNQTQLFEILRSIPYENISIADFKSVVFLFNEKDSNYLGFISKIVAQ